MKSILKIFIVVFASTVVASCDKSFEKHYDLSLGSNAYVLPYTGETFPLYVYCSGEWKAAFDAEADWIRIEEGTERGMGTGVVRITYKDNDEALRSINLVITSGKFTQIVNLSQKYNSTHLEVE